MVPGFLGCVCEGRRCLGFWVGICTLCLDGARVGDVCPWGPACLLLVVLFYLQLYTYIACQFVGEKGAMILRLEAPWSLPKGKAE